MISVCLTTYNAEKYLREQLESILGQLSSADEIVISDDGSTDSTFSIIKSMADARLRLLHHRHFESSFRFDCTTANIANAISHAKGDYIFLADQDDVWMDCKVADFVEALADYDCVVSDCVVTDSDLNPLYESYYKINGQKEGFWNNFKHNSFLGCCMAFRRSVLDYVMPFPAHYAPHDWWIGMNVLMRGRVKFMDKQTLYYRRHGLNLSTSSSESENPLWFKLYYRLAFLGNLALRMLHIA